jgi:tetratricopeptide (TPR) repeat protein
MAGSARLSPGVTVGRYVVDAHLARGGTSDVYLATPEGGGAPVALKVLAGLSVADRARADREARIVKSLAHPHINRLLDHGDFGDDGVFLALEPLRGETLSVRLQRGPLPADEVRALALGLLDALGYAHGRGLMHRDLKPANVFLRDGDPRRPVLLDFGLARAIDDQRLTTPGRLLGTPAYMSPEQVRGDRPLDQRTDLWSLGVMLFEALSGALPFEHESFVGALFQIAAGRPRSLREVMPEAPDAVVSLLDHALRPDLDARIASARDFRERLEHAFSQSDPPGSRRTPEPEVRLVCAVVCDAPRDRALLDLLAADLDAHRVSAGPAFAALFGLGAWRGDEPTRAMSFARAVSLLSQAVSVRTARVVVRDGEAAPELLRDAAASLPARGVTVDALTRALLRGEAERSLDEPGPAASLDAPAPLFGRDEAQARLLEAIPRANRRAPTAVVVLGAPGMGRTTLLDVCAARAARDRPGTRVLRARCERHRAQSPYAALREALWHAHPEGLDALTLTSAGAPDPQSARDRRRVALHAMLRGLSATSPVVLALDDAQWLDPASHELLRSLLDAGDAPSLALWLFADLDARAGLSDLVAGAAVVDLSPLSTRDAEALVRSRAPRGDGVWVRRVVARGGGNPRMLVALAACDDPDALPADVESAVRASLDRLDAEEREFVLCASVFGRTAWPRGAVALGARDRYASLRQKGWVAPRLRAHLQGEIEFEFRSALVPEVARAALPAPRRAELHRLAAAWLRAQPAALHEDIAEQLELAGAREEAGAVWAEAAARASAAGAVDAASAHCERALARTQDPRCRWAALVARDDAMQLAGDRAAQRAGLESLRALAAELGANERAELTWRLLHHARMTHDTALAAESLPAAESPARWRAAAHTELALLAADGGRLAEAKLHAEQALAAAAPLRDDPWTQARTQHAMAYVLVEEGADLAQGLTRYAAAATGYREAGDRRREAITLVNRGAAYAGMGRLADALDCLDLAITHANAVGNVRSVAVARVNRGAVLRMLGDDEGAREDLTAAVQRAEAMRFHRLIDAARVELGYLALSPRAPDDTRRESLAALLPSGMGGDDLSAPALAVALRLATSLGDPTGHLEDLARRRVATTPQKSPERLELQVALLAPRGDAEGFARALADHLGEEPDGDDRRVKLRGVLRRYAVPSALSGGTSD